MELFSTRVNVVLAEESEIVKSGVMLVLSSMSSDSFSCHVITGRICICLGYMLALLKSRAADAIQCWKEWNLAVGVWGEFFVVHLMC